MRLLHFSDIHITADPRGLPWRSFLSKRAVGWANLRIFGRYPRMAEATRIVRALVEQVGAMKPDGCIFSGDVTGLSVRPEFEEAARLLAPLEALPNRIGIPGNHDIYVASDVRDRPFSFYFGDWEASDCPDLQAGETAPYPIVRLLDENLAIIGLQSARPTALWDSSGRVGAAQLAALAELLRDERIRSRRKLLLIHYGPRKADGEPDTRWHGLRDWKALLDTAAEGGISCILHGHIHARFILPRDDRVRVPQACVGSVTDGGHDRTFHVYHIGEHGFRIETFRYAPEEKTFVVWPEAEGPDFIPWV